MGTQMHKSTSNVASFTAPLVVMTWLQWHQAKLRQWKFDRNHNYGNTWGQISTSKIKQALFSVQKDTKIIPVMHVDFCYSNLPYVLTVTLHQQKYQNISTETASNWDTIFSFYFNLKGSGTSLFGTLSNDVGGSYPEIKRYVQTTLLCCFWNEGVPGDMFEIWIRLVKNPSSVVGLRLLSAPRFVSGSG